MSFAADGSFRMGKLARRDSPGNKFVVPGRFIRSVLSFKRVRRTRSVLDRGLDSSPSAIADFCRSIAGLGVR